MSTDLFYSKYTVLEGGDYTTPSGTYCKALMRSGSIAHLISNGYKAGDIVEYWSDDDGNKIEIRVNGKLINANR